ncbi:MAG: excinuclease ABC subunit UvrC [Clostridia bacterium]|nr:excinuclease ABC subunit UvrC [Clostridia bacterium]
MDLIKEKLKDLPTSPGVYLMLDEFQQVLYVGKAKNLKNRVKSYFLNSSTKTEKTILLVQKIKDFRYIVTSTEVEALVLENNLIKQYKPYYNILLKDDKSYPYIKIKMSEEYPRIEITRRLRADGSRYFGPYMIGLSIKDTMELIHSIYPVRSCTGDLKKNRAKRECLNYHIGRCLAPCTGRVSSEEYKETIKKVMSFLSGNDKEARAILEQKLQRAIEREEFELAITYRDSLELLDKIIRKQSVNLPKDLNIDIFSYANNGLYGVINYTVVRGGKVIGSENQPINEACEPEEVLSTYVMQFYEKNPIICDEICLSHELSFMTELQDYLTSIKGQKVNLHHPKGGVRGQLTTLSLNNASENLQKTVTKIATTEALTRGAVEQLKEYLDLPKPPKRMECYDISNISGTDKVASMVVFINGEPAKERYRRFRIKTVVGSDDFASMREVLSRRVNEFGSDDISFSEVPDLIIVDGGKGQLSSAVSILEGTGISVVGLAKREEEIFKPHISEPFILPRDSLALKLCQRIRDEAHRFAITYHRKLRGERQTRSNLKNIEGVGDKKARALLAYFKKVENIAAATVEEIMKVEGFGLETAKAVKKHFGSEDEV